MSVYTYTFDDIQNRPVAVIGAGTLGIKSGGGFYRY